jgi:hypothetical protein
MGTRGFVGIKIDNTIRGLYSSYDSYPSDLGSAVAKVIADSLVPIESDYESICNNARNILWINQEEELISKMKHFNSFNLKEEFLPCTLLPKELGLIHPNEVVRKYFTQSQPLVDHSDFLNDKLFCEWAYILDLDEKKFTVHSRYGDWGCSLFSPELEQLVLQLEKV